MARHTHRETEEWIMGRFAAIDIGTNTVMLLVAQVDTQRRIQPLCEEERIVRLGEGVDENQALRESAMTRALDVLREVLSIAQKWHVERVVVSGTSAIRDATNRNVLLDRIRENLGLEVQVLSGEQEAELTYRGALSNKQGLHHHNLMIDIGGGSTEFVEGREQKAVGSLSVDIGSVRLTERLIHHDPITTSEFDYLESLIRATLSEQLRDWQRTPDQFIGVAGTVTTLAAMHLQLEPYEADVVDGSQLTRDVVDHQIALLKTRTHAERCRLPGLRPERADVILAGAMILRATMDYFDRKEIIVSDRGLRYGVLLEAIEGRN